MADLTPDPRAGDNANVGANHGSTSSYPGTPRWVKVFGIVVIILVLLIVVAMVASSGSHGPARHLPSSGAAGHPPTVAHGMQGRWL